MELTTSGFGCRFEAFGLEGGPLFGGLNRHLIFKFVIEQ